jgi:Mannitol dehydrogenase Rossmann domain
MLVCACLLCADTCIWRQLIAVAVAHSSRCCYGCRDVVCITDGLTVHYCYYLCCCSCTQEYVDHYMCHLGVGGFHRSHQCVYTDDLLNAQVLYILQQLLQLLLLVLLLSPSSTATGTITTDNLLSLAVNVSSSTN